MDWLIGIITKAIEGKFTGSIEIHFFEGGVANVNVKENIKPSNAWKTELVKRLVKT